MVCSPTPRGEGGNRPAVTADLAQGKHPAGMTEDEEIVYQFCKEVHETKTVSDSVFKRRWTSLASAA